MAEERGRVQTFPKGWKWVGAEGEVERTIDDAVSPELARRVALALRRKGFGLPTRPRR